jgi:hypothetical protein
MTDSKGKSPQHIWSSTASLEHIILSLESILGMKTPVWQLQSHGGPHGNQPEIT